MFFLHAHLLGTLATLVSISLVSWHASYTVCRRISTSAPRVNARCTEQIETNKSINPSCTRSLNANKYINQSIDQLSINQLLINQAINQSFRKEKGHCIVHTKLKYKVTPPPNNKIFLFSRVFFLHNWYIFLIACKESSPHHLTWQKHYIC